MSPQAIARRKWAQAYINRCTTPPPAYGSPEWVALPDGPEKVAACVLAAEKWAMDDDVLELNLLAELEADRHQRNAAEETEWLAWRAWRKAQWTGRGFRPDPEIAAEIERELREWVAGGAA